MGRAIEKYWSAPPRPNARGAHPATRLFLAKYRHRQLSVSRQQENGAQLSTDQLSSAAQVSASPDESIC